MVKIICSHGFAMRADSAGMFTDITAAFPDYDFKMFDYYDIKPNGDQIIRSLDEQAKILQQQIDAAPDGEIVLLCHSQGSTVAGLVDLRRISKIILLAPPIKISRAGLINRMRHRKGAKLNPYGTSTIPRSNGTTMTIPVEYMDSIEAHNRLALYQKMAGTKPTTIIRAAQDEILRSRCYRC
jgi:pimeloyl-ACP methyl ester carboxylesterase